MNGRLSVSMMGMRLVFRLFHQIFFGLSLESEGGVSAS